MCTAIQTTYEDGGVILGRNMDLPCEFNQAPILVPKGAADNHLAYLGIGVLIDGFPALCDGMNTAGLGACALNFLGYAQYEDVQNSAKLNLAPHEFIPHILGNFSTVAEVKKALKDAEIVNRAINPYTPIATLHWMLADASGAAIVVERTKKGLAVYDNSAYVLTNNPDFNWHLTNLNEYLKVSPVQPNSVNWSDCTLSCLGVGGGTLGLPGDFSSVSRFVRAAYLRAHLPDHKKSELALHHIFNMLGAVSIPRGAVITIDRIQDQTIYTSAMDLKQKIYYYKTEFNSRINALRFEKKKEITVYDYLNTPDINEE